MALVLMAVGDSEMDTDLLKVFSVFAKEHFDSLCEGCSMIHP